MSGKSLPIKVGLVYGLRVHEEYQRQGVGKALSAELEKRCQQRKVSMLHLTVNLNNERARSLYASLGYQDASDRKPVTKFLTKESIIPAHLCVVQLSPPEVAATLLAMHYDGTIDMNPAHSHDDFLKLVRCKPYETTMVVVERSDLTPQILALLEDEQDNKNELFSMAVLKAIQNGECKSYGGIAFWNGSVHKQFKVERLIFWKAALLYLPFQIAMFVALLSVLGFWWWNAFGRMIAGASWIIEMINNNTSIEETTSNTWGYISLCLLLLEVLGIIATSMGAYKFVHFFPIHCFTRRISYDWERICPLSPWSHGNRLSTCCVGVQSKLCPR